MAKITIELDEQDARIVAAALGIAIATVSIPNTLLGTLFDSRMNELVTGFLGLMAGHKTRSETKQAVDEGRLDEITSDMVVNIRRLSKLANSMFKQTDPHIFMEASVRRG